MMTLWKPRSNSVCYRFSEYLIPTRQFHSSIHRFTARDNFLSRRSLYYQKPQIISLHSCSLHSKPIKEDSELPSEVPPGFEKLQERSLLNRKSVNKEKELNSKNEGITPTDSTDSDSDKTAEKDKEKDKEKETENNQENGSKNKKKFIVTSTDAARVIGGVLGFGSVLYLSSSDKQNENAISFQDFVGELFLKGYVSHIQIVNGSVANIHCRLDAPIQHSGKVYHITLASADAFEHRLEGIQSILGLPIQEHVNVVHVHESTAAELQQKYIPMISGLLSLLFIGYAIFSIASMGTGMGGMGRKDIFSIGKASTKTRKDLLTQTKFKDIAGMRQAKLEVYEFVDFLKNPKKYEMLGAKLPKGGLLVGPPGTGKTLLARAVAGESGVPFFSISGSDFLEMFVGVGPARVRDLFKQAREASPSIVFIDEIDAVGRKRGGNRFGGGGDERENTLNQMLVEMDGFCQNSGVIVLAGTNRADVLDPALTRPGRFDRQITVEKPDIKDREEIYKLHLKPVSLSKDIQIENVAKRLSALTPGFAGADIRNVCNESAIFAARRNSPSVEIRDFEEAVERVIGGMPRDNAIMTSKIKRTVAIHEAGHAVAGWNLEFADPLLKVTIIPRTSGALGFAQYLPNEVPLMSTNAFLDQICMILGGRVAEELFIGEITNGASDDFQKVTRIAYGMAQMYGMTPRGILSWNMHEQQESMYKPFSEKVAMEIDMEARRIVDEQYERCKNLVSMHKEKLLKLADTLMEKETLVYHEIKSILGSRPYGIPEEYAKFVDPSQAELELDLVPVGDGIDEKIVDEK